MLPPKIHQLDFDHNYIKACNNGDLPSLIQIYDKYKPLTSKNKIFSLFLKVGQYYKKSLDFSHAESTGFDDACRKGHKHIVEYLINVQKFSDKEIITTGLFEAVVNNEIEIAKFLTPHISRGVAFYSLMYDKFKYMCIQGNLSAIKYLLTDKALNIPVNDLLNHSGSFDQEPHEGFISACTMGHTKLVRYLTSSPELTHHVDLSQINRTVIFNNAEIVHHFIIELQLPKEHSFMQHIMFPNKELVDKLYERSGLYNNLNSELVNHSEENTEIKKRPKV